MCAILLFGVLHCTRLEMLARYKHASLLGLRRKLCLENTAPLPIYFMSVVVTNVCLKKWTIQMQILPFFSFPPNKFGLFTSKDSAGWRFQKNFLKAHLHVCPTLHKACRFNKQTINFCSVK
jgi:hypothetical protein